jgi:hypothetical protein
MPGGIALTAWLRGFGALVLVTVVAGVVGLPSWLGAVLAFGAMFTLLSRAFIGSMSAVPVGGVPCARCASHPRTATGFCEGCTAVLDGSPLPADHPAHPVIVALERSDLEAARAHFAPKVEYRIAGRAHKMSRRMWLLNARASRRIYPDRTGTILALHLDPANSDNIWVRTHDVSRGLPLFASLDVTVVARYRMPHDEIVEIEVYPALATAV